ncbi:MAG TPA: response regulator [Candidatus Humimicrobiaceae bacterium]|nr:response regulator [Candidatus Humimicrobiaceae bacterium]
MKRILLIEDDPFLVDIYTTKFKESGFDIEVATDGEQGLRELSEKNFDLLLLDIVLPQVDGWEVLEKIKALKVNIKHLENLKIIILSNLGQKEEVERGIEMGAIRYFIKAHYTPSEVVAEIEQLLKRG